VKIAKTKDSQRACRLCHNCRGESWVQDEQGDAEGYVTWNQAKKHRSS